MTPNKLSKHGRVTALMSFIIGTVIFCLYYLTDASEFLLLGYGFIAFAGVVNIIVLICLIRQLRKSNENKKNIMTTCILMLVNLPIMLLYCWITIILLNTMRITFVNETSTTLTDLNIYGCEKMSITKLEPGERKQVWIKIPYDCAINIDFLSIGKRQSENVTGYVTNNMGKRMTHKIGWENSPATMNR